MFHFQLGSVGVFTGTLLGAEGKREQLTLSCSVCRSIPVEVILGQGIFKLHSSLGSTNGMNSARIEQMTEMPLGGSVLADRRALLQPLATFT